MSKYRDTLEVGFNYLQKARWETFLSMPSVAGITYGLSDAEILRRDAWIFMVRTELDGLQPFYFDAIAQKILPFSNNAGGGSTHSCSYSQTIGDGINREFIVTHGLNSMELNVGVWADFDEQRLQRIDCDIFLLKNNLNQIGFSFSSFAPPPELNEFIVVITSGAYISGGGGDSHLITVNPHVVTLPPGEPALVVDTGIGGNPYLNFSIPGSPKVTVNPQVVTLPPGEPVLVVDTGIGGNPYLTFSIPGSPKVTVNPNVVILPPGESASVIDTGIGGDRYLTFNIPMPVSDNLNFDAILTGSNGSILVDPSGNVLQA